MMAFLTVVIFCLLPALVQGLCVDLDTASCPGWKAACHNSIVANLCKRTCKTCGGPPPPKPPTVATPSPNPPVGSGCGNPSIAGSRVIAGINAVKGSWPWQALLLKNGRSGCGGSLIDSKWVLTAAHCVYGQESMPSSFSVRLGEHDRGRNEGSEQTIVASRIITYSGYNPRSMESDIALIELSSPARFNNYVSPVCLPSSDPVIGSKCYITGWGKISSRGSMHHTLQQADLKVVSNTQCGNLNTRSTGIQIRQSMLCAGSGGSDRKSGCQGDSGGPFVCTRHGKWEVHGAVSWGSRECRSHETYTVFARVFRFTGWIRATMGRI